MSTNRSKKRISGSDRITVTERGEALLQMCQCGHSRAAHHSGFEACHHCNDQRLRQPAEHFACKPGLCDRFTWKQS